MAILNEMMSPAVTQETVVVAPNEIIWSYSSIHYDQTNTEQEWRYQMLWD